MEIMPGKGGKSITINEKVFYKMGLTSKKVTYELEKRLEDQEAWRKFASKITKMPKTVRVYSPFTTKREREKK